MSTTKKKRGRPLGFKLSEESKRAISKSKTGQRHTQETRDKISKSLTLYFKRLYPLSDEIVNSYCRSDDDNVCEWANSVGEQLDSLEDVRTSKSMKNSTRYELCCGDNIDQFIHTVTPETILLVKEHCKANGLDVAEFVSEYM